jgi:uncharacterized membrane protein
MKEEQDYIRDLTEIRSMMERSTRFLSLSGWAGVMAGIYALTGTWIAWKVLDFNPTGIFYGNDPGSIPTVFPKIIFLALAILILAITTAVILSLRNAGKKGEKIWNATSRRLLINMAVPLVAGGLLILVLIANGLIGLIAPFSLLFYGLALYNAAKFTYEEMRFLGLIQIGLGLISSYFTGYGLFCWALGFGVCHIIYGIYLHYRYER